MRLIFPIFSLHLLLSSCYAALSYQNLANDLYLPEPLRFEPIGSAEIVCFLSMPSGNEKFAARLKSLPKQPYRFKCISQPITYHTHERLFLDNPKRLRAAVEEAIAQAKAGQKKAEQKRAQHTKAEQMRARRTKAGQIKVEPTKATTKTNMQVMKKTTRTVPPGWLFQSIPLALMAVLCVTFVCIVCFLLQDSSRRETGNPVETQHQPVATANTRSIHRHHGPGVPTAARRPDTSMQAAATNSKSNSRKRSISQATPASIGPR